MIEREKKEQVQRLRDIKERLFGNKHVVSDEDSKRLLVEFNDVYTNLYQESNDALSKCIKKVEKKFDKTNKKEQENFDYKKALFKSQHKDDEFFVLNNQNKDV